MELLGQEIILALLWIECTEEPKLVLRNWSTDIAACVELREPVWSRTDERKFFCISNQTLGCEIAKSIAVKFVTAALGDDVKNTTSAATILSAVRASFDFNFLHKLERKIRTRATEGRVSS